MLSRGSQTMSSHAIAMGIDNTTMYLCSMPRTECKTISVLCYMEQSESVKDKPKHTKSVNQMFYQALQCGILQFHGLWHQQFQVAVINLITISLKKM